MYKEFLFSLIVLFAVYSCDKNDHDSTPPTITFNAGEFTTDGQVVPVGGGLSFSITANGGGAPLTNLLVKRIADGVTITELDFGMYVNDKDFNRIVNAVKSPAEVEVWRFMVMNANKDSAIVTRTVLLGEGSAYGPIKHFPSIKIGMQNNGEYPHFLDLHTGELYTSTTVVGNEAKIDLLGFVYLTGGIMSPTLSCPQYSSVPGHYPTVSGWTTRNSTLYDYNSVDNDLVNPQEFESAANDSLLVASYRPQNVSGLCKYCFTNKIVPFKTHDGKFGLIRILYADVVPEGYMELEVKVQE